MRELVFAGFGGQGVLTAGLIVAQIALYKKFNATWMPAYGAAMKRIDYMKEYTDPVELKMMVTIKNALDPNWILNPGKVFSVPE